MFNQDYRETHFSLPDYFRFFSRSTFKIIILIEHSILIIFKNYEFKLL